MNKVRFFEENSIYKLENRINEYAERKEIIAVSMNPIEVGYSHTYYATVLYKDDDEGLV